MNEGIKLSNAQVIDSLWKLTEISKELNNTVDFLRDTLYKQGELLLVVTKELKEAREELDGLMIHYGNTLKEMRTTPKHKSYNKYIS